MRFRARSHCPTPRRGERILQDEGPWAPPEDLPGYLRRIEDAAAAVGRDGGSIRRVYNLMGAIGPASGKRFAGPASYWVDELGGLVETGMDAFIFWPGGEDPAGQVEAFAAEVVPGVRSAVGGPG